MTVRQRTLGAGTSAFATMFPELLMLVVEPAISESKGSEIWRLPSGDRAVGFAEIPADAGLSPCRASIPDAEQAPLPVISVRAAMLGGSIYKE